MAHRAGRDRRSPATGHHPTRRTVPRHHGLVPNTGHPLPVRGTGRHPGDPGGLHLAHQHPPLLRPVVQGREGCPGRDDGRGRAGDPDADVVLQAVKGIYKRTVGRFARVDDSRSKSPLYRPDWRLAIVSTANVNLLRKVRAAGLKGRHLAGGDLHRRSLLPVRRTRPAGRSPPAPEIGQRARSIQGHPQRSPDRRDPQGPWPARHSAGCFHWCPR